MHASQSSLSLLRSIAAALVAILIAANAPGQTPGADFFEKKIRPIFSTNCQPCHGARQPMAGLDLTTAAGFRKGADSGPLVSGTDPTASRLMRAVSYRNPIKMPPAGKLKDDEIASLGEWIAMGAPWPPDDRQSAPNELGKKPVFDLAAARQFWSFQPVRKPTPPDVRQKTWVKNPIDAFILAKLEEKRLDPAPPADRVTLLRRVTYDLTGLPPTEAEIRDFLQDSSADAYNKVVDRLLASPRYGERWGRHWMDVARYADSTGADEDHRYPYAWRYRDYVIEALNRDLPYDQFVREQIAGDLLPADNGGEVNVRGIVATGFLALGPKLIAEQDKPKMFYDTVDEEIDVTSRAFLGLTIACARCHNHKFDPILTRDYYSLASIFASTKQFAKLEGTVSELYFAPLAPKAVASQYEAHQTKIKDKQKEIDELLGEEGRRYRDTLAPSLAAYMLAARCVYQDGISATVAAKDRQLDEAIVTRWAEYLKPTKERRPPLEPWYQAKPATLEETASAYQQRFIATATFRRDALEKWKRESAEAKAAGKQPPEAPRFQPGDDRFFTEVTGPKGPFALPEKDRDKLLSEHGRTQLAALESEIKKLKDGGPPEPPMACGVAEGVIVDQKVFIRGNPANLGEPAPKAVPIVLAGSHMSPITQGSGRRELAEWMSSASNPLTARVMANRLWQWHFREGIVRTPSNFGKMGERPTHPELLDYLASTFVEQGWSMKAMHRMILLSNTYQMSSLATSEALERDPDGSLLSHYPQRRLEVEEIRDSLLMLDGSLDFTMGGALQTGKGTDKEFSDDRMSLNPDQSKRRTVYLPLRRSNLPSVLTLFDFGDAATSGEGRSQTNVAPQALYMMNGEFVARQVGALAGQLLDDTSLDDAGRIRRAYARSIGRLPEDREIQSALRYIQGFPGRPDDQAGRRLAWTSFCRTLVASNDFLYVH
jgi:mono/diheme cytochrome c family protein